MHYSGEQNHHDLDWKSFDWWRGEMGAKYSRPPSPFPASFETSRGKLPRRVSDPVQLNKDTEGKESSDEDHKLSWPLCIRPNADETDNNGCGGNEQNYGLTQGPKKTGRRSTRRPAWIPPSNPSKGGAIFHPPPYTNRCKETVFDTKNVHPMKRNRALKA